MTRCRCASHMLARRIKRETVPSYLQWIPDACFPHISAAVSQAESGDGRGCDHHRRRSRSNWSFIMPFDLEHYIEDHSCSGEHKPY